MDQVILDSQILKLLHFSLKMKLSHFIEFGLIFEVVSHCIEFLPVASCRILLKTRNPLRRLRRLLLARPAGGWLAPLATTPGARQTTPT